MVNNTHSATVLITRPESQGEPLSRLIEAAGGVSILFPTITIAPTLFPQGADRMAMAEWAEVIVFLSANAVLYGIADLQSFLRHRFIVAIGPGTARALEAQGVRGVGMPSVYNSESIVAFLLTHECIYKNILIVCGENPREYLEQTLLKQGAAVKVLTCYRRLCPAIDETVLQGLQKQPIDVIVSTSQEGLKNLYEIFKTRRDWLCALPILVISPDMAVQASRYGFKHVLMSDNASDPAIMETLHRCYL